MNNSIIKYYNIVISFPCNHQHFALQINIFDKVWHQKMNERMNGKMDG